MTTSDAPPLSPDEIRRMRLLLDEQDIRNCLARVARGSDRFDRDLFVSAFHPGAIVNTGGMESSAEETYEGGRSFHDDGMAATLHCLSTLSCDIDGDTAHVETYHIYLARNRDENNWAAAGRYVDQFERRGGVWGIVFRRILVEWTGLMQPNALALLEGAADGTSRLGSARGPEDASYLRPLKG